MSPELHQQIRKLFDEALERPKAERQAYLEKACAGQPEVLNTVQRLLAAHVESDSFLEQKPEKPPLPERIGRYQVTGELGRGAMGIVYEAIDPLIGRSVAVKVIRLQSLAGSGDAQFLTDRLFREARSAGSLSHPGIVTIFDVGREQEAAFIAMERVEGQSLQEIVASRGKLGVAATLDILRQAAAALDYAHAGGVVHRDIKPANIMLHKGAMVKITDFGIAKVNTAQQQTATGMVMGTPSYMSPEQIYLKPLDGRSDQFALAVVAYELLTGQCPFCAESIASLVMMIVSGDRPAASQIDPSLPTSVDAVLRRGLSKEPGDRFASCAQFASALDAAFRVTPAPAPKPEPPSPPKVEPPPPAPTEVVPSSALPTMVGPPPIPVPAKSQPGGSRRYLFGALGLVLVAGAALVYKFGIPAPGGKANPATPPAQTEQTAPLKQSPPEAPPADQTATQTPPSTPIETKSLKPVPTKTGPDVSHATPIPPPVTPTPEPNNKGDASRAGELYTEATVKKLGHQSAEALALFRQSAALGDARSMAEIGKFYLAGDGVGKDPNEAATWFRKAADAGNPSGMVYLAAMYAQGSGVPKDDGEAVRWFRKAADAGDRFGMDGLGQVYANGRGVPKDDAEAARWFQKAADAGNPSGMYHLATMYDKGSGVPKDSAKATEWYQKAAGLGSREAQARLAQPATGSGAPSAPGGGTVHVRVTGNQTWTDTGIDVNMGDTVHVGTAGSITLAKDRGIPVQSPDGSSPNCAAFGQNAAGYPAPQLPCWSLIGRIGPNGLILAIGTKRVIKAPTAGRLYFGINDNNVQGNSGIWTALVVVQPAR